MYIKQRTRQGGGVGYYIKQEFSVDICENDSIFIDGIFESLTVKIKCGNKDIILSNFYKPNNYKNVSKRVVDESFQENFTKLIKQINDKNLPSLIVGDSNLDLFKVVSDTNVQNYTNTAISEGFLNVTFKATRCFNTQISLIDHIMLNFNPKNLKTGVLVDSLSDHFHPFINFSFGVKSQEQPDIKYKQDFSDKNIERFREKLDKTDWRTVLETKCPEEGYAIFWDKFQNHYEDTFPQKKVKNCMNSMPVHPFMNGNLLELRMKKLKLHKKWKVNPNERNRQMFIEIRNRYNKKLRENKKNVIYRQILNAKRDPKKLWDILKNSVGMSSKSNTILEINGKEGLLSDKLEIADEFNEYFSSIGEKKADSVPYPETGSFRDYLPPPCTESIFLHPTSQLEIYDIVTCLESKKSQDINGISSFIIKRVNLEIANPLSHIINQSLETGIFPSHLKLTKTVPIYKKEGCPKDTGNYRPISLVNIFSKIFEKVIYVRLKTFLDRNNFFYRNQYGFREKHNVQQAVVKVINFVSKALNDNQIAVGIFLDISKAFDTVDRKILFSKLENAGIRGLALELLKNYLSDRYQKVYVNGTLSQNTKRLSIGLLQGSVLASLLFLIYVNDFNTSNELFNVIFADDTSCLAKGKDVTSLAASIYHNLDKIFTWYCHNRLALNVKKTNYMVFSLNDRIINDFPQLEMNNVPINKVSKQGPNKAIRMLGVYLDQNLNFREFAEITLAKVAKSFFIINRSKNFLPDFTIKLLYYALIHSHLNFASIFLFKNNKQTIEKIQNMQKRVIRMMSGLGYLEHTSQAFLHHQILPFTKLIEYNVMKFLWEYKTCKLPDSFRNEWVINSDMSDRYDLRNSNELHIPRTKYCSIDKMTYFSFPRLWEEKMKMLPSEIDANVFFPSLKSLLLCEYTIKNNCQKENCYSCKITKERKESENQKILQNHIIN